ncbi:hypothetical protein NQZ79_g4890 [Umbelopsis isabellina]|nr:hypothetical protein NQZ79_g4890 [Umbelopsis isabellina]
MGQTLSEPVVEKHSTSGGDSRVIYGASEMQGWRITLLNIDFNTVSVVLHSTIMSVVCPSAPISLITAFDCGSRVTAVTELLMLGYTGSLNY